MSFQLNLIIGVTKLLNVKKIFTLSGTELKKQINKKQKKVATPKKNHFINYKKDIFIVDGIKNYKFKKGCKNLVIYLPGGGFILPISGLHWDYLDMLSQESESDFLVINYPLTPKHNVVDIMTFINKIIKEHCSDYSKVTLIGDSAGGNIALSYSQSDYNEDRYINNIIALSPLVDFSLTNSKIKEVEKYDTIVSYFALKDIQKWYKGDYKISDPIISPINGDYSGLNVIVISGTRDITNPDCKLFSINNPNINYLEKENLPHNFMLFMIPEAKDINKHIINILNN